MTIKTEKILIGVAQVQDYLGGKSAEVVKKLIEKGLPARQICGTWYSHTDNIDDWFKLITRHRDKNPPKFDD